MSTLTLIAVSFCLRTGTIEATLANEKGERCYCENFQCHQVEELRALAGPEIERYIDLAGWTPEYIAAVAAEEQRLADAAQDKADAEEAERKAAKEKAEQEAFDAEVARQVKILEAAKKIVAAKG